MNDDIVKEGCFFFNPEDPIYGDHFPGNPVVPASLIVHAFMEIAGGNKDDPTFRSVANFRFKRFVSPGRYAYRIEVKPDGRMDCRLFDNEKAVVTGSL